MHADLQLRFTQNQPFNIAHLHVWLPLKAPSADQRFALKFASPRV
jgi:hypothetical protein